MLSFIKSLQDQFNQLKSPSHVGNIVERPPEVERALKCFTNLFTYFFFLQQQATKPQAPFSPKQLINSFINMLNLHFNTLELESHINALKNYYSSYGSASTKRVTDFICVFQSEHRSFFMSYLQHETEAHSLEQLITGPRNTLMGTSNSGNLNLFSAQNENYSQNHSSMHR